MEMRTIDKLEDAYVRIDEASVCIAQVENFVRNILENAENANNYPEKLRVILGSLGIAQDVLYGINK